MRLALLLICLVCVSLSVGRVSWQQALSRRGPHHLEALEPFVTDIDLLDDYFDEYDDGGDDVYDYDWLAKSGRNMGSVDPPWRRVHGIEDPGFRIRQPSRGDNRRRGRGGRVDDVELNSRTIGRRGGFGRGGRGVSRRPGHHVTHKRGSSKRRGGRQSSILENGKNLVDWVQLAARLGIPDWDINFGFDFDVEFSSSTDWWRGPNVCKKRRTTTERKENPSSSFFITKINRCQDKASAYVCESTIECGAWKNTSVVTYTCCSGFGHRQGELGCQQEVELKDILEVLKDLDLTEFRRALSSIGLNESLTNTTLTLLAPPNEKLKQYTSEQNLLMNNLVVVSQDTASEAGHAVETVLNHIIPKRELLSHHMIDDMVVDPTLPGSQIRFNKDKRTGVITANCVKLVSVDNLASNGIIHVAEDIIPTIGRTTIQILQDTGNHKKFIEELKSKWNETLRGDDGYTIIAPTDNAFNEPNLENLLKKCFGDHFLRSHVIKNSICPTVITTDGLTVTDLNKKRLRLTKDAENSLFLSGVKVTASYVASDGVVLVVDKVLGMEKMSPVSLAKAEGATEIINMIKKAELLSYVESMENATLFLPTNGAIIQEPKEEMDELMKNKQELKTLLKYHFVSGLYDYRKIKHARHLPSMSENKTLTVNSRHWIKPLVQCAQLVKYNLRTCSNVNVFLIDKVLHTPQANLLDTLSADPQFTEFVTLLRTTGLHHHLQSDHPMTILAPTNAVFQMSRRSHGRRRNLKEFIKSHIIRGVFCCKSSSVLPAFSLSGMTLNFRHVAGDVRIVNRRRDIARISACDLPATNGIIHVVDQTLEGLRPGISEIFDIIQSDLDDFDFSL
ncbi:transforming growth factor-beta-induced protein ig-h3-like [Tubulanus polymorphus]|uniref:transforming growth factor-beta-induced protein ig-h3-like n=1 Tax=Tubulanus polymorphus TaxID=672921 RepID=UPI003DA2AA9C